MQNDALTTSSRVEQDNFWEDMFDEILIFTSINIGYNVYHTESHSLIIMVVSLSRDIWNQAQRDFFEPLYEIMDECIS